MSQKTLAEVRGSFFRICWPPLLTFVLVTVTAELVVRGLRIPAYQLPAPSAVFASVIREFPQIAGSLGTTAIAAGAGFVIAVVVGILLAIALSTSRLIQRAFYPYTVFFQTVPVVAVAPLLVIWFGAGLQSVTICALIVSVFPVIANTLAGLLSTDPALREMFQLYGASWWASLLKLRLPAALPNIVTGMRIAAGLAVIGTIVGEFVAAVLQGNAGLGVMVLEAKRVGRTDLVFAAILAASALGLAMFGLVNLLGYWLLHRWHASERS